MNQRNFVWILMLLLCWKMSAQSLKVVSITENRRAVLGREQTRLDLNNHPCALLKVTIPSKIIRVDGNSIGNVIQKKNEQWVYITSGTYRINLVPEDFLPVSLDFRQFGIRGVKGGITYYVILEAEDEGADMNADELYAQAYGNYLAKDYAKAFIWAERAEQKGSVRAISMLGQMYLDGKGGDVNAPLAFAKFRQGAVKGDDISQYRLAACYDQGFGTPADSVQALYWYQKAADQNFADAYAALAEYYEEGKWVEKDEVKALELAKKGSQLGGLSCDVILAKFYENGVGTEKDHQEAMKLLRQSASNGNELAKIILKMMTDEEFKSSYLQRRPFDELLEDAQNEMKEKREQNN